MECNVDNFPIVCSHAAPMANTKEVEDEKIESWCNGKVKEWLVSKNRLDKYEFTMMINVNLLHN